MPRTLAAVSLCWLIFSLAGGKALAQAEPARPDAPPPRPVRLSVSVRMMGEDEIRKRYDIGRVADESNPDRFDPTKTLSPDLLAGIFVGPLWLFAGVQESTSSTTVMGPPHGYEFQVKQEPVRRFLVDFDFAGLLTNALRDRVGTVLFGENPPEGVSVAIAFYGLQTRADRPTMLKPEEDFCLVFTGAAVVLTKGGAGSEEPFYEALSRRSPGMGAPRCGRFSDFADFGGMRLRQVMKESADTLSEWIFSSLLGARPKTAER
jgi:hypothetical protein